MSHSAALNKTLFGSHGLMQASSSITGRSIVVGRSLALCLGRSYATAATPSRPRRCPALLSRPSIQQYRQCRPSNLAAALPTSSSKPLTSNQHRFLSTPKKDGHEDPKQPGSPLTQKLDVTRQKASVLGDKVRSSLTSLTPRENIYNIPNILTASRLVAAPVVGYLVLHGQHKWALGLFAYAGITDLIDGWMARKFKLQTVVGSVIDPMADKVLMTVLTVTLAMNGLLPVSLATLILGRDASLATAAIYWRYASLPTPKTFRRYWDFSLPSAEVHPTTLSKYNTFLQLLLIGATLAYPVITADNHHLGIMHGIGLQNLDLKQFMTGFQVLVAGTTAWSGMSYAFLKDAVKILGKDEALKVKQGRRGRAIIGVTFGSVVIAAAYLALTKDKKAKEEDLVV